MHISGFLNGLTLGDLIKRNNVKQVSDRQDVIMMQLQH